MQPRIIFCIAVSAAILAVILLAVISPVANRKRQKNQTGPSIALSLYIQHPQKTHPTNSTPVTPSSAEAFVFHHTITEGAENSSPVIGKAQGFIIPIEHFAHSMFNIIYLTFNTPQFNGSLSVQAKHITHKAREELTVVGGTGSFAFARGIAVFAQKDPQPSDVDAIYHVKLLLKFPSRI
ncbi:dirigent protein 11 [Macadamia integrifolia]|uniref:dirigent protein 11 n=1 Tax=Macadamia integrifolia TaxID=60698 RepID=UPI001C4E6B17|nr:dirigent protein 11 [Macadamia integrifolia]